MGFKALGLEACPVANTEEARETLRRGEALDVAAHAATQGLPPSDRAFAIAIASETLRWMVDIDALIAVSQLAGSDAAGNGERD